MLPRSFVVSPSYFPPFSRIMASLAAEAQRATFWTALAHTLESWAIGLAMAVSAGAVIGILIGSSLFLREATVPRWSFCARSFGRLDPGGHASVRNNAGANLVLVVYARSGGFSSRCSTACGRRSGRAGDRALLPPQSLGAYPVQSVADDVALPDDGIRLAAAVALILTITAELIIGTPGPGQGTVQCQNSAAYDIMYVYVVVTGIIGVAINMLARAVERVVMPWHSSLRAESVP